MSVTLEPPVAAYPQAQPGATPTVAVPPPAAAPSFGGMDAFGAGLISLEGTAVQFGIVPVRLPRETCSVEAEATLRKLGRFPNTNAPWLPVANLGPLLIFAHHNPKTDDLWGVPACFAVKIAISSEQYEAIRKDLVMRLQSNPLPRTNPLEALRPPEIPSDAIEEAFFWLLQHYPFDQKDRDRLEMLHGEMVEKQRSLERADYDTMMPGLGVALQYLIDGPTRLCFNADEVCRQEGFSVPLLEKHNVYPLYRGDNHVYLLTPDGSNYAFEDEYLSSGNDPVEFIPVLADARQIRQAINRCGSALNAQSGIEIKTSTLSLSQNEGLVEIDPDDVSRVNPQNLNHSAEELIHWVLYTAISARASDLHLEKYYNVARFRARIDGNLKTLYTAPEEMLPRFIALIKNYSNMNQSRQEALDGRFAMAIRKRRIDVRVAAVPCRRELQKVIMRFLDKQDGLKELADLNFSRRQSAIVKRVMSRDQGLILITGPTGSGKTTTLYALINSVNEEGTNIHTIEDPIEYEIEGINQTQTDPTHGLSFSAGLRSLLRSDPDVILIGECRDEETANAAVNAALTGHLVLTTLHANDSLRAISRLLSMNVEPHLVADSIAMTQAQRLVRRLCNYCKRPYEAPADVQQMMYRQGVIQEALRDPIYMAVGCPECHGTGYRGRVALMEMLETNAEITDLIERHAPQTELRAAALRTGFQTLYQEGLVQTLAGNTTLDEIAQVSYTAC
ncbi:MAG: type II/IV secretion system protein [Verrucomicrobiales bacterium]|nr:type II/IV secretion system protein [Verrucomicrobiales bacterium]